MTSIISLLQAAITFGTVILFGALGEIITEKSGNLNLGTPGIMYFGGIASLAGAFLYESNSANPNAAVAVIIALICAMLASAFAGLIYAFLTITLRANQNVTGLTLTIFGSGVANFFGGSMNQLAGGVGQISVATASSGFRASTGLSAIPVIGPILFSYGFLVYAAIVLAILLHYTFARTRIGLNLRAVGESPATADAAGINVTKYKYAATCIGSAITGIGGLFYVMDYTMGTWANDGTIESLGWLALALVIFAAWKPVNAVWGSYLFGILYWLYFYVSFLNRYTTTLFQAAPYVVTIVVLIITSVRKKKENLGPAALGLSYFREER